MNDRNALCIPKLLLVVLICSLIKKIPELFLLILLLSKPSIFGCRKINTNNVCACENADIFKRPFASFYCFS